MRSKEADLYRSVEGSITTEGSSHQPPEFF